MAGNPAWSVRALSVPGPDTELALYVAFDDARFLFGAGEAVQRSLVQKRVPLRNLQCVFLNSARDGHGGLPGVLMTLTDAGITRMAVRGTPDIAHHIATLRASVIRHILSLDLQGYPRNSTAAFEVVYTSPRMTVHAVRLGPEAEDVPGLPSPSRPSELSQAGVDECTRALVHQMFKGEGHDRSTTAELMARFESMLRPPVVDDRYPLPLASDADVATELVYILRTPDVRGKFDVERAKSLGVPNGPVRGLLTKGQSIEIDDAQAPGGKRTVTPEECLVGGGPGATLVIARCSEENLPRLVASRAFEEYHSHDGKPPRVHVHAVVHCTPRSVWEDPRYQAWMAAFGPDTQHLYADTKGNGEVFFRSATWNALQLNFLDSTIFPVPHFEVSQEQPPAMPSNAAPLVPNTLVPMYPSKEATLVSDHEKDRAFPTTAAGLEEARQVIRDTMPEYAAAAETARRAVAEEATQRGRRSPLPGDDIVVTTLGTGSAIPSKYRNVSSTHLDIPGLGGVLLDAGEGTLGQLRRRYGPEELPKIYENLRMIFISHMHADHHLGLASVLKDRLDHGVHSKLYLVAPHPIALQLEETAWWQEGAPRAALENIVYINNNRLKTGWRPRREQQEGEDEGEAHHSVSPPPEPSVSDEAADGPGATPQVDLCEVGTAVDVAAGRRKWPYVNVFRYGPECNARFRENMFTMLEELGLAEIRAPLVAHRGAAWGLVLTGKAGWRVAYSGDTKPCDAFVEAGADATILIHEATLEDDEVESAVRKGHSTFGQAMDVGRRMRARYVILNHFSQRYPKIPRLPAPPPATVEDASAPAGPAFAVSFDFMSLRAADTWKMSHFVDALSILYAGEEDDGGAEDDVAALAASDGDATPKPKKGKSGASKNKGGGAKGAAPNGAAKAKARDGTTSKRPSDASTDEPAAKRARDDAKQA